MRRLAEQCGFDAESPRFSPMAHDEDFVRLHIKGAQNYGIVRLITEVFNAGEINMLVGTQVLLFRAARLNLSTGSLEKATKQPT